ncbi:hypothetical protein ULG90_03465 [Halopseudomonas pachastrellae]|nr:hypothetical protein ULG90_03465 [Halopseudomonas pachastrellae]
MLGDVGIDVLGGLLAADAKALDQVLCGQPTFPPGNRFDQAVAKGKIPADGFRGVAAFMVSLPVRKLYLYRINNIDLSRKSTYVPVWLQAFLLQLSRYGKQGETYGIDRMWRVR